MNRIPEYWKAVVAFVVPGVVILASGLTDASDGGKSLTQTEWLTALFACVLTAGGVAAKRNADPGPPNNEVQDPEAGNTTVVNALITVLLVVIVVWLLIRIF